MERSNVLFHYFENDLGQGGIDVKSQGSAFICGSHLLMVS